MKRRTFIVGLGSAAAWPVVARGQQPSKPVIGYLGSQSAELDKDNTVQFLRGMKETGYVDEQNVAVEYRWAENQVDRLPALAACRTGVDFYVPAILLRIERLSLLKIIATDCGWPLAEGFQTPGRDPSE